MFFSLWMMCVRTSPSWSPISSENARHIRGQIAICPGNWTHSVLASAAPATPCWIPRQRKMHLPWTAWPSMALHRTIQKSFGLKKWLWLIVLFFCSRGSWDKTMDHGPWDKGCLGVTVGSCFRGGKCINLCRMPWHTGLLSSSMGSVWERRGDWQRSGPEHAPSHTLVWFVPKGTNKISNITTDEATTPV